MSIDQPRKPFAITLFPLKDQTRPYDETQVEIQRIPPGVVGKGADRFNPQFNFKAHPEDVREAQEAFVVAGVEARDG
jgi:hypothetical protein